MSARPSKAHRVPSPRVVAAEVLVSVINSGESLDDALESIRPTVPEQEAALVQEIVYGVLRHYFQLRAQLNHYMKHALRARDAVLEMLLLAALYELQSMRTPAYAVVDQTVNDCTALSRVWAKRLVNAVLRSVLRNTTAHQPIDEEARTNHPHWLVEQLQRDWPTEWTSILMANQARAPLTIRVNRRHGSRDDYLSRLAHHGIDAQPTAHSSDGISLLTPRSASYLAGFDGGDISVQDEAPQLAAHLLQLQPQQRVLDACCAPGGKACHMLELEPTLQLTALDRSAARCAVAKRNFARLGINCDVLAIDALDFAQRPNVTQFARILIDAPCTATGVIRRHPDIKLHRQFNDAATAATQQLALLNALWPLLAPGGLLLYATCSVLRVENDDVLAQFIAPRRDTALVVPIPAAWGIATEFGRQILPGEHNMDGFFYALLTKPYAS